jgi:hypothetical protein
VYKDLVAYIDQVRNKVKEKAGQLQVGGISTVLPAGAKVDDYTARQFSQWLQNMEADRGIAESNRPLDEKIRELEGGRSFFQANRQMLEKHPSYAPALDQMASLLLKLGELKTQKAVAFAQKGLKEMNENYFNETSGTYQQLHEAERLLAEGKVKGEASPEYQRLVKAIADAGDAIAKLSEQYNKKAAAEFRLPADQYAEGDKGKLSAMVLAKWKAVHPEDQVLALRFPKASWERQRAWTWNNGSWYYSDNSTLLAYVVIRKSAELATVYPAYVYKDNENGAFSVGANTKGALYAHQDMLLKNLK